MTFFGDDDIRMSHTIRIFGTNKNDEILTDIWLDLERIDVYRMTTRSPEGMFQGIYRRLYWNDDPDDYSTLGGIGNSARSEGLKKICSPDEENQEDPEEWIPVRTIIEMDWNETTLDHERWKARRGNRTSADNLVRAVEARRCFHRETIIDDIVEKVIENNPTWKQVVFPSNKYDFSEPVGEPLNEESYDADNYIEVQYVSCTADTSGRKEDAERNQVVQTSLKNIHYLYFTKKAEGPVNKEHGFDPPWSLDPFQAIVNVNFGGLAVEFGEKDHDAPPREKT